MKEMLSKTVKIQEKSDQVQQKYEYLKGKYEALKHKFEEMQNKYNALLFSNLGNNHQDTSSIIFREKLANFYF